MGDKLVKFSKSLALEASNVSPWGWLLIMCGFALPFYLEGRPLIQDVFVQTFCGIHLLAVIILSYYFGLKGAVFVVVLGTFQHFGSDFHYFDSLYKAISLHSTRLVFSLYVGYLVGKIHKREEMLAKLNQELEVKTHTDWLTGLYNSQFFFDCLDKCVKAGQSSNLCILMVDIDNFKNYNDTLGHLAGDQLLKELAEILRQVAGEQCIVARYGGEEFAIIIPCESIDIGTKLAEKLRSTIAKYPFTGREVQEGGKITVSIGVACYPQHGRDVTRLVKLADEMLYKAKRTCKNCVRIYNE